MWVEICRSKEDWNEFLDICGVEFADSAVAIRYVSDVEKRKRLMPLFFQYLYEARYSDDRGMLVCVKTNKTTSEGGKGEKRTVIIAAWLTIWKFSPRDADISRMIEVDKEGTERLIGMSKWREQNIHHLMSKAANDLGMRSCYAARILTRKDYQGQGILKKYTAKAYEISQPELAKKYVDEKPFVNYWITVERAIKSSHIVEIAHLHYNYKAGLRCCEDTTAIDKQELSCQFVLVEKPMAEKMAKIFHHSSHF